MRSAAELPPLRRVLIVDDDPDLVRVLEVLFERSAVEPLVARSLKEAREKLTPQIQLVLLDVRLPDGSALELAERAARLRPAPAVIAMSGGASPEEAFRLARVGVQAFLAKPFTSAELDEAIDAAKSSLPPLGAVAAALVGKAEMRKAQDDLRRTMLHQALALSSRNLSHAARLLGISRQAVQQMLRDFGEEGAE